VVRRLPPSTETRSAQYGPRYLSLTEATAFRRVLPRLPDGICSLQSKASLTAQCTIADLVTRLGAVLARDLVAAYCG